MNTQMSDARHERAGRGIAELGDALADHEVLSVQCPHSHHVGAVFETPTGLVYRTITGPHARGRRDRPDVAHHGSEHGVEYVEMLDSDQADDVLPGWCACGPWSLSRTDLLSAVRAGERTTRLA